mgnify:CR=1 FL=1
MKLTDLKSPYRELAEMRHEQKPFEEMERNFLETNYLYLAFVYDYTKEGYDFWECVNYGKSPDIPKSSLDELDLWLSSRNEFLLKGEDTKYEPILDFYIIKYYEDKIEMLIRTSAEKEIDAWNAAIDAAAEVARLEVTEIATGEKVITIDASVNGITSVLVSKQSILNLKK